MNKDLEEVNKEETYNVARTMGGPALTQTRKYQTFGKTQAEEAKAGAIQTEPEVV